MEATPPVALLAGQERHAEPAAGRRHSPESRHGPDIDPIDTDRVRRRGPPFVQGEEPIHEWVCDLAATHPCEPPGRDAIMPQWIPARPPAIAAVVSVSLP